MEKQKKLTLDLDELRYRQSLPFEMKIKLSFDRIRLFAKKYGTDGIYVSFSGGLDSRVALDIARKYDSGIIAVYLDTWLEYPEIRQSVAEIENVIIIKPDKTLKNIIKDNGWCYPSKDVSEAIEAYRRGCRWAINKLNGLDGKGKRSEYRQQYKKWLPLAESNIPISNGCCLDMKERPASDFEAKTGLHPILGLLAEESERRKESYLRTGCNSFESKRPNSKPLGFWTKQDIYLYYKKYNLELPEPYGYLIEKGQVPGQTSLFDFNNCSNCKPIYCTTGEKRTGCMFCPIGCHLDGFKKFKRLKKKYPSIYDYCMEELNEKQLIDWIKKNIRN